MYLHNDYIESVEECGGNVSVCSGRVSSGSVSASVTVEPVGAWDGNACLHNDYVEPVVGRGGNINVSVGVGSGGNVCLNNEGVGEAGSMSDAKS